MADKDVNIAIKTTATGDGAAKVSTDLDKINASGKRAEDALEDLNRALQRDDMDQAAESAKEASEAITEFAEASGVGEEAVAELKEKLDEATASMNEATKATEESTKAKEENAEAAAEETKEVEKHADAQVKEERATKRAERGKKDNTVSARQMASGVAQASVAVVALGRGLENMADMLESTDPALAQSTRQVGEWTTRIGSAVGTIALGFAAGGPVGAGVAALGVAVTETMGAIARSSEEAAARKIAAFQEAAKAAAAAEQEGLAATRTSIAAQIAEYDKLTAAVARTIAQLKLKQQIEDEIAGAQLALDIAKVDAREKGGSITAEEAIVERSGLRQGARAAANERENFATENEIVFAEKTEMPAADANRRESAKAAKVAQLEADVARQLEEVFDKSPGLKNQLMQATNDSERRGAMEDIKNASGARAYESIDGLDVESIISQVAGAGADGFKKEAAALKENADKAAVAVTALKDKIHDLKAELEKDKKVQAINEERFTVEENTGTAEAKQRAEAEKQRQEAQAKAARDREAREEQKRQLAEAKAERDRAGGRAGGEASELARDLAGKGNAEGAKMADAVAKALSDGFLSAVEQGQLAPVLQALMASKSAEAATLQSMMTELHRQQKNFEAIKSRMDKGGY